MKGRALAGCALLAGAAAPGPVPVPPGAGIARVADLPSGAPAFEVRNAAGVVTMRIECLPNAFNSPDMVAARLLASRTVLANILEKDGKLALEDLGPVYFDCVPARH